MALATGLTILSKPQLRVDFDPVREADEGLRPRVRAPALRKFMVLKPVVLYSAGEVERAGQRDSTPGEDKEGTSPSVLSNHPA